MQHFSRDYLERCAEMSPEQIIRFLEEFRILHGHRGQQPLKSRLISLKVPEPLLGAFKTECHLRGIPYQTQIKRLMRAWLDAASK